ncbi:unnamed protein product [Somion occarium]
MWGNPGHLAEMKRIYTETLCPSDSPRGPNSETVHILVVETNTESSTYDGIDWGGERVAEEIRAESKRLEAEGKTVTRFSVTGYSLGGLIARYVIGILHQQQFFDKVTPVNFTTVATPHIGLIRYPSFRSSLFAFLGPKLLSRTGEQFYAVDQWSARGRPLLEVMADPERIFFQALSSFPHVTFYANAVNDITVPYMTAAAELDDPFAEHLAHHVTIEFDEKYKPIVKSWTPAPPGSAQPPKPRIFSRKWFESIKPRLPPALDFKFPYNIIIIVSLPVLFPALLILVVVRLSMDSHSSRSRIKLLEEDESYGHRLIHVVGQLEKSMEDAVAELIDDQGNVEPQLPSTDTLADTCPPGTHDQPSEAQTPQSSSEGSSLLTPRQRRMVATLNSLPELKKELAFINPVLNSHATIVARDIQKFKHHAIGHGVLQHVADHFTI